MSEPQRGMTELVAAGDWEAVRALLRAEEDRMREEMRGEREALYERRRNSSDRQERALQAHLDGGPDWRAMMPLGWRASRWWSLYWPVVAACSAIVAGLAGLWTWALK